MNYQVMMDGFSETTFKILPKKHRSGPLGSLGQRVSETLQLK